MPKRKIPKYSWNWLGFVLGPFYFFIAGAYLSGAIVLGVSSFVNVLMVLLTQTTKFSFTISLLTGFFCGIQAEKYTDKPMQERRDHYLKIYRAKGYEGRELTQIVQKKMLGFFRIFGGFLLSLFMYYTIKIVIGVFLSLLMINVVQ